MVSSVPEDRIAARKKSVNSTESREVAKRIAVLALDWIRQDGSLKIRQREELRRALTAAGGVMGWEILHVTKRDPVAEAAKDLSKLTASGARAITRELSDELEAKKGEVNQLKKVASNIEKMAKKGDFPSEVTYAHTTRNGSQGLATKTETVLLNDPDEAQEVVQTIEKKLETWCKLRDQMLEDLKAKRAKLEERKESLSLFVDSSHGLLGEVLAIMH